MLQQKAPPTIDDSVNTCQSSVFLLLLAVQIGVQPVLMAWYAAEATNVPLRIVVINVMKLGLALGPLVASGRCRHELSQWSAAIALRTTVLPACIYVVQDYLNQTAVLLLDGVTYNVLNQTKIIWTALFVYYMLGKRQSHIQLGALVLLVASAVLIAVGGHSANAVVADELARVTGMTRACIAAVLSALAGTIIQKALQREARDAYVVTIELAGISIFSNAWPVLLGASAESASPLWKGWTSLTVLTLFVQACGGVLVGFVIKHSGNIKKSFAVVLGLLLTAVLESVWNGKAFGTPGYAASVCVMLSTHLYTKYPPSASRHVKPGHESATKSDDDDDETRGDDASAKMELLRPRGSHHRQVATEGDAVAQALEAGELDALSAPKA
ncbi:hypothetical protein SPRG_01747 [Saprolegnia parasitica CBS 223.65]|uniref:Sugar phosphate transporter domain-containing protein n=1 Tax=Saprolegnia parasitica (strain CBS 223.65) TaxID=695850 RepID=A0A067CTN6_SAPPC|nr:hypothetical protein SPRG_01747 [Saprolegnia parasitica CBS 223.65]KDO33868.1 hypothetical protein SPRG_01747 [Saprolegnia parasitica CBS 223.65]|eukprot:XP_012195504.1 hypothetical protein SPRG_01747 [Saprolegnia parasitica CBS 223.65]